jgi:hypothetical protein
MKDFVYKDKDRFLEIADAVSTPFKVYELTVIGDKVGVDVKVWLRTAYISYYRAFRDRDADAFQDFIDELQRHGFAEVEIRETAFPLR